jgi:dihydrolipoamide dehydrogenase
VTDRYEVIVLGGGPGGYATALRAVRHGRPAPQAREPYGDVKVTRRSFAGNARAAINGLSGHVKVVCAGGDGCIVGAHAIGPSATELIAEFGVAVSWEALAEELGAVVHAHPTVAENVREASLAAAGMPFHVY